MNLGFQKETIQEGKKLNLFYDFNMSAFTFTKKKSLEGFDNEIMSFRAQLRRYIDFIIFCNL